MFVNDSISADTEDRLVLNTKSNPTITIIVIIPKDIMKRARKRSFLEPFTSKDFCLQCGQITKQPIKNSNFLFIYQTENRKSSPVKFGISITRPVIKEVIMGANMILYQTENE